VFVLTALACGPIVPALDRIVRACGPTVRTRGRLDQRTSQIGLSARRLVVDANPERQAVQVTPSVCNKRDPNKVPDRNSNARGLNSEDVGDSSERKKSVEKQGSL